MSIPHLDSGTGTAYCLSDAQNRAVIIARRLSAVCDAIEIRCGNLKYISSVNLLYLSIRDQRQRNLGAADVMIAPTVVDIDR